MIATREIRYRGRVIHPGEQVPDDPVWRKAWLDAGSVVEEPVPSMPEEPVQDVAQERPPDEAPKKGRRKGQT